MTVRSHKLSLKGIFDMKPYSMQDIALSTGGELTENSDPGMTVSRIITDSRTARQGDLFVAISGTKSDGHDFIEDAVRKGCSAVCASVRARLPSGEYSAVIVDDTLTAYQKIAYRYRVDSGYSVIAVTGSVGKTSTREFIASALSSEFSVHRTQDNFNNEIGLPRTLLEAPDGCDFCVVEMAMRAEGQIRELTMTARPDVAVITNIGSAHIGILGSREAIFRAKTEIVEGLTEGGLIVLNCDDDMLRDYSSRIRSSYKVAAVFTGEYRNDIAADILVRGWNVRSGTASMTFDAEITYDSGMIHFLENCSIPCIGAHNISNALLGIAAAVGCGASIQGIRRGFASYLSVGNRQRIIRTGGMTVIDDTYNAGPESMKAAIDMLASEKEGDRHLAVLGGMLELGDFSRKEHIEIGRFCAEKMIDVIFVQMPEAEWFSEGVRSFGSGHVTEVRIYEDRPALLKGVEQGCRSGDVILVKGSRGFRMEEITSVLTKRKESDE